MTVSSRKMLHERQGSSDGKATEMFSKTVCSAAVLLMWMHPFMDLSDRIPPSMRVVAETNIPKGTTQHLSKRRIQGIRIHPLSVEETITGNDVSKPTERSSNHVSNKRSTSQPSPRKASTTENPQPIRFHTYMAENGDTLKTISQKFYGSSLYFPVILLHNPQIQDFDVEEGLEVRLLEDAVETIRLFRQHTVVEEGKIFWIYTAQKNDTLEEIGRKFYRTRYQHNPLVNLNPEARIRAGEHIRILLN